jgi:NAD(P)-dependent dehydrogenase (short-subunit alcohol dehydrogenase family)
MEAGAKVVRSLQDLAPVGHTEPVAECIACDLASLQSVKSFANECISRLKGPNDRSLQLLLLNAGMCPKTNQAEPTYTVDGFEECFATNHLSHFLLAKLLLPKLKVRTRSLSQMK